MHVCTYVAMYTTLIAIASFSYQVIHAHIRIAIPLLIASYSEYLAFSYSMRFSYQVSNVFQFIQWQFWLSCVGGAYPGKNRAFLFCFVITADRC